MADGCIYCSVDTGGNHQTHCPLAFQPPTGIGRITPGRTPAKLPKMDYKIHPLMGSGYKDGFKAGEKQARAEVLATQREYLDRYQKFTELPEELWPYVEQVNKIVTEIRTLVLEVQPAAKDLEAFEKRVRQESYGAARILWVAGICDLLKMPKPRPDESGLEWLLREGNRALEALLRETELKGYVHGCKVGDGLREPRRSRLRKSEVAGAEAELEKARAEGKV